MNLKDALQRIKELERKVHELEARAPMMIPYPVVVPAIPPQPYPPCYPPSPNPHWWPTTVWCGVPTSGQGLGG